VTEVVEAHLANARGSERALESAHEVRVVEDRAALGVAEHEVVVGAVGGPLMVSVKLARDAVGHWHRGTRSPSFGVPQ